MSETNNSDLIKVNIQYLTTVERKTRIIENNIEKAFNLYQRLETIENSKIAGDIGPILSRIMPFTPELKKHCNELSQICRNLINDLNTNKKDDGKLNSNELIAIKSHIEYIGQYAASKVPELNKINDYEKKVLETETNLSNEIIDNEKYKLNFISSENNIIYKNFEDMKKSVLSEDFNPEMLKKFEIIFETFKIEIKNIYDSIFSIEPKDKDWAKKMGIFNEKLKNKNFYDIFVKASKEENYAQIINSELR